MDIKKHSTHKKYTGRLMFLIFIFVIISCSVGFYAQEVLKDKELVDLSIIAFIIFCVLFALVAFVRSSLCFCPACKSILTKKYGYDPDESRKFVCDQCEVIWDTGVIVDYRS